MKSGKEKNVNQLIVSRRGGITLLLAVALVLSSCSHSKPDLPANTVLLKVKKGNRHYQEADETDLDNDMDGSRSPVYRGDLPLAGTKWEWEGELGHGQFEGKGDSSGFVVEFKPNGWFDFQADCRRGSGIYEVKGQRITLAVIKANRSHCHSGSRSDDFLDTLEAVRIFRLADNRLYFDLKDQSRTMVFGLKP